MCHKHLDKSVLMHLFKFPFTNTKIIIQYRLTCTSLVVSITEIIEYYKKGYMSATVGTRWHLMSSDDLSSLSNLVSTTCESSESASQTYNPFYNIPPITSAYQTTYKSQFTIPVNCSHNLLFPNHSKVCIDIFTIKQSS